MKYLILYFFLVSSIFCASQSGLSFTTKQQLYLKGESALIGNNIVSTDAVKPYNDNSSLNDQLKLEYIDVDDDPATFSSSKANLVLDVKGSNIKYAGLYWSAVYKYDKGTRKKLKEQKRIVYRGKDERSTDINSILFKQPNGNYQKLIGETIFDSFDTKLFDHNKPYLCYADVTALIKNSTSINGTYTLGNIRATEGFISGGASGGWLLYVIYESPKAKPKYFTTYNGFVEVKKEAVDITFKDFKTDETGAVNTSLCIGALEGDQKYKTDSCFILDSNNSFVSISNKLRPKNNFFNGTISIHDELYTDRTPNSSNTLGFDLLKIDIPNPNNSIIYNNTTQTTIRFKTKADRFYLFFVAFETEISPIYLEGKNNVESILVLDNDEENTRQENPSVDIVTSNTNEKELLEQQKAIEKIKRIKSISIPSIPKGYYLVTNVFSVKSNTTKWMHFLEQNGYQPKSYTNPKNGWHYIYLKNDEDPNAIYLKRKELSNLEYFQDIWILKINF